MMEVNTDLEDSWKSELEDEFKLSYFVDLKNFLVEDRKNHTIYPPEGLIFNAFNHAPFNNVRVVIIGQDPYHGPSQAHGLSFSVPQGIKPPPSLKNIFKELNKDLDIPIPTNGNLESWAQQGVLLINATLTVRANQAGSHQKRGWETFTNAVIKRISDKREGLVFILWGRYAQAKEEIIDAQKHHILKAAHPSPLSAHNGFFGCKHFSKTNEILKAKGLKEINWKLEDGLF